MFAEIKFYEAFGKNKTFSWHLAVQFTPLLLLFLLIKKLRSIGANKFDA